MKTNNIYGKLLAAFLALSFMLPAPAALAQIASLCTGKGYTIGFFNGVWNMPDDAANGMEALAALQGETYNGKPITYDTFYNATGASVGSNGIQDVLEVFTQRANVIDASGELAKHTELFWETLTGQGKDQGFWGRITDLFPAATDILGSFYTLIATKTAAVLAAFLSNPPTDADYRKHESMLEKARVEGQMLLLVAHSQGNLFVNRAADYIRPKIGANSVRVVHVAPASPTVQGDYVLADIDLVINGLRVQGWSTIQPVNIKLSLSKADPSGHTLVNTYLDATRESRARVGGYMNTALAALQPPSTVGNQGFFTVTLTWDGAGDVDLHTFEPDGSHSYYGNPTGNSGYLDVDNTVSAGPEHYYASCDASKVQTGTYKVGINNFAYASGRRATVQIASSRDGELLTRTLDVGPEMGWNGNSAPIMAATISVTRDASGALQVVAN